LVVLNLEVSKTTSVQEINAIMKKYALRRRSKSKLSIP
jgi:glyceraldehyde 3-phosphate dehydrogenase